MNKPPQAVANINALHSIPEVRDVMQLSNFSKLSVSRQHLTPSGQKVLMAEFTDSSCRPVGILEDENLPSLNDWNGRTS